MMLFIHRQYDASRRELAVRADLVFETPHREERVVVPIPGINRAVIQAVNVGRSIADDVRAVFITDDPEDAAGRPRAAGSARSRACRSSSSSRRTARSPGRSRPTSTSSTPRGRPDKPAPITFVVLPEYVARRWWERILYNQSVKRLRSALLGRPHTVVVNVPYRREDPTLFEKTPTGGATARTQPVPAPDLRHRGCRPRPPTDGEVRW